MSKKQIIHNPVLHKTILIFSTVWIFMALDFVYAEGQSYIYASDIIKGKRHDNDTGKPKKWLYQQEKPLTFQNNRNTYQSGYNYPPPIQKYGSNPITKPQYRYQFFPDNNKDTNPIERKNHYNYPPPIQKFGSNPFIKPND